MNYGRKIPKAYRRHDNGCGLMVLAFMAAIISIIVQVIT